MINNKISVLLEEHRALRNEIEQHRVSMRYMTIFNITASGTIFSFVFSNTELSPLLLVVPILSATLGYIFFFHSKRLSRLGLYIRDVLAPKVRLLQNDDSLLEWEHHIREEEKKNKFYKYFSLDGIRIATFLITSVTALAVALPTDNLPLWIIGLLLTIFLLSLAWIERKTWLGEDEKQGKGSNA